ncbi:hypothetical protein BCR44DRAFT_95407 [Catenaria anguillulae PL171]|uniref:Ubiquitin-like protease family profile domain-containing protein n=1 Tax=Catenaria anguillulae PL171 TaxID=765915 RepID=A0A1Y2HNL7_9FUNG|nr:hypothetical protein BCR44DRAFT_95407 [Catenaria anguillulae PL171]
MFPAPWVESGIFIWHATAVKARIDPAAFSRPILSTVVASQWALEIGANSIILVPVLVHRHWLLGVLSCNDGNVQAMILNSMKSPALDLATHANYRHGPASAFLQRLSRKIFKLAEDAIVPVTIPVVPQQPNTDDCGIFALSSVETFMGRSRPRSSARPQVSSPALPRSTESRCVQCSPVRPDPIQDASHGGFDFLEPSNRPSDSGTTSTGIRFFKVRHGYPRDETGVVDLGDESVEVVKALLDTFRGDVWHAVRVLNAGLLRLNFAGVCPLPEDAWKSLAPLPMAASDKSRHHKQKVAQWRKGGYVHAKYQDGLLDALDRFLGSARVLVGESVGAMAGQRD